MEQNSRWFLRYFDAKTVVRNGWKVCSIGNSLKGHKRDILFFYYHIIIEQKTILNPLEKPVFSVIKKVKTKLLNSGF